VLVLVLAKSGDDDLIREDVACAENTKAENSVAEQLQQGCTPQPRPEELQEWR
jgi:hypothetical protein